MFDNLHARIGINNIVLTGGVSKIYGLESLSYHPFNRNSRIGKIENTSSFSHNKPEFSSLLGLVELSKITEFQKLMNKFQVAKYFSIR